MSKTIYIIRHGETDFNRLGIVQGGGVDSSLNETGRRQAIAFFERYRDTGFEAVLTSTLQRTHQTMAPFLDLGLPWEQFSELNEMNWGRHEGKESTSEMRAQYQEVLKAWKAGRYDVRLDEGESAAELGGRLRRFIDLLQQREEQTLLICSHGRAMRALVCLLKEQELSRMDEYHHANTGLYLVHRQDGAFVFELENDVCHLASLNPNLV